MPARSSATSPCFASPCLVTVLGFARPSWRFEAANTSAASTITAVAAATQRLRTMKFAHEVQARLALSSLRMCGQSSFGPSFESTTGSSVTATRTLISGISMPP